MDGRVDIDRRINPRSGWIASKDHGRRRVPILDGRMSPNISIGKIASVLRVPVLDDISVSSTGTRRTNGSSPAAVRRSGTLARLSTDGWRDGKTDV